MVGSILQVNFIPIDASATRATVKTKASEMIAKNQSGKVVVVWDFSSRSLEAFEKAVELAQDLSAIQILHVAKPIEGPDNGLLYAAAETATRERLKQRFERQIAEDARLKTVSFHVAFGQPLQEIARFADRAQADSIVLNGRANRGITQFFGRFSQQLSRKTVCSVFVVDGKSVTEEQNSVKGNGLSDFQHRLRASKKGIATSAPSTEIKA